MNLDVALAKIRSFPNVPKEGVIFRDITPLLADGTAFNIVINAMITRLKEQGITPTMVASPEARGFIFGIALALRLNIGFVPIRKPGKLPGAVVETHYDLEYGQDTLQMHKEALTRHDRVILVDDVLATGGTIAACKTLIESEGAAVIGSVFLMELEALHGADQLANIPLISLVTY